VRVVSGHSDYHHKTEATLLTEMERAKPASLNQPIKMRISAQSSNLYFGGIVLDLISTCRLLHQTQAHLDVIFLHPLKNHSSSFIFNLSFELTDILYATNSALSAR
jgi:hypothetical protein